MIIRCHWHYIFSLLVSVYQGVEGLYQHTTIDLQVICTGPPGTASGPWMNSPEVVVSGPCSGSWTKPRERLRGPGNLWLPMSLLKLLDILRRWLEAASTRQMSRALSGNVDCNRHLFVYITGLICSVLLNKKTTLLSIIKCTATRVFTTVFEIVSPLSTLYTRVLRRLTF